MTAMTQPRADAPPRASLTLSVVDSADIVARVLTTLHRRRCHLLHVDYTAGEHGRGRLLIDYVPPLRHGHCVAAWVANLVDVLDVRSGDG